MKKEFIECGKVIGTHGVRGLVKLLPWSDTPEFVCSFKRLYIGKNNKQEYKVLSAKVHGNIVLLSLDGISTIEDGQLLKDKTAFINRNDIELEEDRYFISDILDAEVFDADTNAFLGILSDVSQTGANDVWHITKDGKEYLVPVIDEVVVSVDIDNAKIIIKPLKGIFDDED